jgi:hypothetical protein
MWLRTCGTPSASASGGQLKWSDCIDRLVDIQLGPIDRLSFEVGFDRSPWSVRATAIG